MDRMAIIPLEEYKKLKERSIMAQTDIGLFFEKLNKRLEEAAKCGVTCSSYYREWISDLALLACKDVMMEKKEC